MKQTALRIFHCNAWVSDKQILFDVSLAFPKHSTTVIMGPNGSGKSTLAHVIMGDPIYRLKMNDQRSKIHYEGKDITNLSTEERARLGMFLSFQSPITIPGVSVVDLLRSAYEDRVGKKKVIFKDFLKTIRMHAETVGIAPELLTRGIHEGFSGGERKKIELLQALVLAPSFAVFDEIDTGLDVDALRVVADGIRSLERMQTTIVIITHNHKILSYIAPDTVIVMDKGNVVATGDVNLAQRIEEKGFRRLNFKSQASMTKQISKKKF